MRAQIPTGKALRDWRERFKVSRMELAGMAGVDVSTICRIEHEAYDRINNTTRAAIARAIEATEKSLNQDKEETEQ